MYVFGTWRQGITLGQIKFYTLISNKAKVFSL